MKFILILLLFTCNICFADNLVFDNRGVTKLIDGVALAESVKTTFGTIDVSEREAELNILVYGTSADSLVYTIDLYGMMSPNLSDSAKAKLLFSTTINQLKGTKAHADTLFADSMFPYLYGHFYNIDGNETVTVDVWLYMKPRNLTIFRK